MNHPVTQPVSSLLSLVIGSRFEDRLVRKVKSVFASGTRYRKSSQERCSSFELFDQELSAWRRVPAAILSDHRGRTACFYRDIPRRGLFRSRHDIILGRALRRMTMTWRGQRCENSCLVCPVATTHVLSLSTVKSKPENVLIPVRFQRGTLARSRNPAIAIDGFLRNLAVVTRRAAKLVDGHDDDIRVRKEFVF